MAKSRYIVGVDEVGRGPLAGPVTVCAFSIPERTNKKLPRYKDSKRLTRGTRERLAKEFKKIGSARFTLVSVSASLIDRRGIEWATHRAVRRAIRKLGVPPKSARVLLDGRLRAPKEYDQQTIVHGDELISVIAIASIIAKVHRDRLMARYAKRYPGFGFEEHAGYGTRAHYRALRRHGESPIHRRTFLGNVHRRD